MNENKKTELTRDELSELIKSAYNEPSIPQDLERKVMMEVARRSIKFSRRKAKLGLVVSLSGLAMLWAGCIAILISWFPAHLPLKNSLPPKPDEWMAKFLEPSPLPEQWGGWIIISLIAIGAVGFIYYLNSLFSDTYSPEDK